MLTRTYVRSLSLNNEINRLLLPLEEKQATEMISKHSCTELQTTLRKRRYNNARPRLFAKWSRGIETNRQRGGRQVLTNRQPLPFTNVAADADVFVLHYAGGKTITTSNLTPTLLPILEMSLLHMTRPNYQLGDLDRLEQSPSRH